MRQRDELSFDSVSVRTYLSLLGFPRHSVNLTVNLGFYRATHTSLDYPRVWGSSVMVGM